MWNSDKTEKIINYDQDLFSTLFQMYGSVWPKVYPYCCVNVLLTFSIFFLRHNGIDPTFPSSGHSFMAIMVSFLIVSRAQTVYSRYMQQRDQLGQLFRASRDLVQHIYAFTAHNKTAKAKDWRNRCVYHIIVMIRVTIGSLAFESSKMNAWDDEDQGLMEEFGITVNNSSYQNGYVESFESRRNSNFRAPITLIFQLRKAIMSQRQCIFNDKDAPKMNISEELKILQYVSEYFHAYNNLVCLIDCPFPFPLVQMARTFLFFWVFTLPFVLVDSESDPIQIMIMIFFSTYGFVGIEYVSMELDDPFGDDPNDFDDQAMAQVAIDDILLNVFQIDGPACEEFVKALSNRGMEEMTKRKKQLEHNAFACTEDMEIPFNLIDA